MSNIIKLARKITIKQNRRERAFRKFFGEPQASIEIIEGKAKQGYVVDMPPYGRFIV